MDFLEKLFDKPEWLKIHSFQVAGPYGELVLKLQGKSYWFPVTSKAYNKFTDLAIREDRGSGLRYLQRYIRRYKGYNGHNWGPKYYRDNRMPGSPTRLVKTVAGNLRRKKVVGYRTIFGSPQRYRSSFGESVMLHITQQMIDEIASRTGLPKGYIPTIVRKLSSGEAPDRIGQQIGVSEAHILMARSMLTYFGDSLIERSITRIAKGDSAKSVVKSLLGRAK